MKREINAELILKTVASYENVFFQASVIALLLGILSTTAGNTLQDGYKVSMIIMISLWLFSAVYNNHIRVRDTEV